MMVHRGTDPEAIKVAERFGLTFDGMMEDLYQLTVAKGPEKAKGITFYVKDLSQVEARLHEKFKEFGIEEGTPGMAPDKGLLKVAIEREPLKVARQLGYEVHRLSPTDIVDKADYASGYRFRLSKAVPNQPYPQIVMARSEGEVVTFLKRQIETGNPDNGTCYEDAWRFLMKEGEGSLVHGTVRLYEGGRAVNHAWVELPTGWIWEPQTKSYFTLKDFEITSPIEEHRYTTEEAAIMLARVGKHGPWTTEERARWLPKAPPAGGSSSNPKEPWQMTIEEYRGFRDEGVDWTADKGPAAWGRQKWDKRTEELHASAVRRALFEGKPVPPEVLADYPELTVKPSIGSNPMITDVDTALKDIADWYVDTRRGITEPELESILLKHCGSEAEVQKFVSFLETEPGQLRFKTLLRERKGG